MSDVTAAETLQNKVDTNPTPSTEGNSVFSLKGTEYAEHPYFKNFEGKPLGEVLTSLSVDLASSRSEIPSVKDTVGRAQWRQSRGIKDDNEYKEVISKLLKPVEEKDSKKQLNYDPKKLEWFAQTSYELGFTPEEFSEISTRYAKYEKETEIQLEKDFQKSLEQQRKTLARKLGATADETFAEVESFVRTRFDDDTANFIKETGWMYKEGIFELLRSLAKETSEARYVQSPDGGFSIRPMSPTEATSEIERINKDEYLKQVLVGRKGTPAEQQMLKGKLEALYRMKHGQKPFA